MTLVEIQRLLNGTVSVTEVLEAIDEAQKKLERTQRIARLRKAAQVLLAQKELDDELK
jgi:hypothetical protein|tara:strand:+ start:215 stop:388 length:174 start_codon:yes stop_codon:yes gene_type:complete